MADASGGEDIQQARIMLGLLDSVERDGAQSQRRLASELGIALGLVNAYLKRCVKKGLVKASQAPARRYVYYLTPQGFAEKSRLTVEYLSFSFGFFRQAKHDFIQLFGDARARGFLRVALIGKSDLAEIAAICALESGVEILGTIDQGASDGASFVGHPLRRSISELSAEPDAVVITELFHPREALESMAARFGEGRVLIPQLLRLRLTARTGEAS